MLRTIVIFSLSFFLMACGPQAENFAFEKVNAGAFSQEISDQYTALLQRYVAVDGSSVNYANWLANPADLTALKEVVNAIAEQDLDALSRNDQLAFLINAYNALTLDLILSNYADTEGGSGKPFRSGRSIRNIQNLNFDVWNNIEFTVAGESLSLNALENEKIRSFNDARIHFAVNCASVGCPPLLNRSFTGANLDADLDALSAAFVNSNKEQQTTWDLTRNPPEIRTSEILRSSWFEEDFVNDPRFGSVKNFFKRYVDPAIVANPDDIDGFNIRHFRYDWALNETI